jgi:hypothetical protein
VYLRARRPLRLDDPTQWTPARVADALHERGLITLWEARRIIRSPDPHDPGWYPFLRKWVDRGYDCVVYRNRWEGGGDSYVVWHPEQIVTALSPR